MAANGADVITQLTFTASSGALSTTRANVGTLLLTGYNLTSNGTSTNAIVATDTINGAIQRLEYRLNDEITNRGNAITTLTTTINNLDAVVDVTKTEIDGSTARTAANNGVFALQAITETDGKIVSMTPVEVDAAGAAATAQANAIAAITTQTFDYAPLIANPNYDSNDPNSEEFIRDTNNISTKTIGE